LPVTCVGWVILDLTGRSPTQQLTLCSKIAPACRLEFAVLRRSLVAEDARVPVTDVTAGQLSVWLLGWVPLMQHGGDSAIIAKWRTVAEQHLPEARDRADLGSLALVLARLAGCRDQWEQGLRGWNMETSPFLDEIRAESREEGREKGRGEEAYAVLLRLGRIKFGRGPSRKQQKELKAITELGQLRRLTERLLEVDSWAELLNGC
jgi:hypothetical protein